MAAGWVEARLEQRQQAVRNKMVAAVREQRTEVRRRARGNARMALVLSFVVLAALTVEIGRKAVVVMHHADAAPAIHRTMSA